VTVPVLVEGAVVEGVDTLGIEGIQGATSVIDQDTWPGIAQITQKEVVPNATTATKLATFPATALTTVEVVAVVTVAMVVVVVTAVHMAPQTVVDLANVSTVTDQVTCPGIVQIGEIAVVVPEVVVVAAAVAVSATSATSLAILAVIVLIRRITTFIPLFCNLFAAKLFLSIGKNCFVIF
jgi:hypothetical protein